MKQVLLSLLLLLLIFSAHAQLVIRNVIIVDVENKKLLPAQTVMIQDGKIMAIGKRVAVTQAMQIIDGSGKYLVPGYTDAHVHFFQSGGLYTRPDVIDLRKYKSYNDEIAWTHRNMEALLHRYLRTGITTVVDVGATTNFLTQRDSFRTKADAPTVYMTGPLLTTWEPEVYKNLKGDEPFWEMKTVDDARSFVQKQLPYHPDFIKIWYIVQGPNVDSSAHAYLPLVRAVINEAHKNNMRVAVHATERITAQLAAEAGADFLVHDIEDEVINDAFVQLLKNKKVVLCPTLVVAGNYGKVLGQSYSITSRDLEYADPTPLNSVLDLQFLADTSLARLYRARAQRYAARGKTADSIRAINLKRLLDGGVTIAVGTDAGNIGTQHVSSYWDELDAMQQSGLNMWQLLQAATINGAKAVGKELEFGVIKKGAQANLLLLDKNPLDNLANWRSLHLIINKGIVMQPDSIVLDSPETLADAQLAAYNAHNLDAFLEPYADDVEIYRFPDTLKIKGKSQMRTAYNFLNHAPNLHCRLQNRMVQGDTVIDQEEVTGLGDKPLHGVAIYKIENGKIVKAYLML